MRLYIITGTSEGIGASLAEQLLSTSSMVYCLSKTENPSFVKFARMRQLAHRYHLIDLSDIEASANLLEEILHEEKDKEWEEICLVLNAAVIQPIHKVGKGNYISDIQHTLQTNLLSPMVLSEVFFRKCQDLDLDKQVLILGSRAGANPVASFSTYCSTKAGLDTFAKTLALEQVEEPFPIKVVCLHPGTVDTAMQAQIRAQHKEVVPSVEFFVRLKEDKQLLSPLIVACEIVKLLKHTDYGKETIVELADLLVEE